MRLKTLVKSIVLTMLGGGVLWATAVVGARDRKFDEYGNIRWSDERARLDNFAVGLQNDPSAQGYVICYGGRIGRAGEAQRRCNRAISYLDRRRFIQASRLVTVDGGYRENLMVELWIVPPGGIPPQANPTVDPREVKIVRSKSKRRTRHKDQNRLR